MRDDLLAMLALSPFAATVALLIWRERVSIRRNRAGDKARRELHDRG